MMLCVVGLMSLLSFLPTLTGTAIGWRFPDVSFMSCTFDCFDIGERTCLDFDGLFDCFLYGLCSCRAFFFTAKFIFEMRAASSEIFMLELRASSGISNYFSLIVSTVDLFLKSLFPPNDGNILFGIVAVKLSWLSKKR